jgi:hypothetical protein
MTRIRRHCGKSYGAPKVTNRFGVSIARNIHKHLEEAHDEKRAARQGYDAPQVLYRQHQTFDEREAVAHACSLHLHLPLPILVEEMDNAVDEPYGAAPERLYVIGADGRVVYQGGAGPHFFDPDAWERAIEACVETGSHVDAKAR